MTPHRLHIRDAARRLEGIVEDPIREAGVLLAIALGLPSRADIFAKDPTIDAATSTRFGALVAARAKGVPVAYLRGHTEFFSHRFAVGEGVLVPRPDTERLVEEALALLPERGPCRVVDLGTGCGAVALSLLLARPEAHAVATDVSRVALSFAARNAASLGVTERVRFVRSDWLRAFRRTPWATLVVSNPPYVGDDEPLPVDVSDHEPSGALFAGPDGLRDIRRLLEDTPGVLRPGGRLLFEIGWTQADAVRALAGDAAAHWRDVRVSRDLAGRDRVVSVTRR